VLLDDMALQIFLRLIATGAGANRTRILLVDLGGAGLEVDLHLTQEVRVSLGHVLL